MAALAVVLLIDLVLAYYLQAGWRPHRIYGDIYGGLNILSGLAVGQACLAAVWLAFRRRPSVAAWVLPPIVLFAASWVRMQVGFFPEFTLLDYACRNLLQALVPLVVLWLLVRIPLWRRVSRESDHVGLQLGFSIKHMLFWMTSVAAMAALIGRATQQNGSPLAIMQWMGLIAPGLVAVPVVLIRQTPIPLLLRLPLHVAVGAGVGYGLAELAQNGLHTLLSIEFAAQAVVLALGVELGRVTLAAHATQSESEAESDAIGEDQQQ
ncbi:hypothetical protein Pla123a_21820 [Posidoniimonas polymericola]|uniref:Uncharacterized protein n=1 Tax=Posidoniimonas polymericola TaxID=2528002 RepID=A0A5C5YRE9_9BACT|nr:hypothetical protein [Posidoniimonas polymericola]TWT77521.1 hypothetical protein Pla123a_21820 [Posidoniimonas polymericola]